MGQKYNQTNKKNQEEEMAADKQFIRTTNEFHQRDLMERYQKKKQTQAHLANFYNKQHNSRIDEENDNNKLLHRNEFLLNKKLIKELELLPEEDLEQ